MASHQSEPQQCWFVLGASSAIGRAFAKQVAKAGHQVVLLGRDEADLAATAADLHLSYQSKVAVLRLDLLDFNHLATAASQMQQYFDSYICHLFVCSGLLMPMQDSQARQQTLLVNFNHVAELLMQLKPAFAQQQTGHIIVLGSVAGDRGRAKNFVYGAAKAGLHTFLQGYRAVLHASGITVTTIKPGFVDTAMTYGLPGLFAVASPEQCASFCYQQAMKHKLVCYFPRFWWLIMTIIRFIPERMMQKLSI